MARPKVGWWLLGLTALVGGCGPGAPGPKPTAQIPWGSAARAASQARARWAYTPATPRGLLGHVSLGEGRDLYFGRHGERWVVEGEQAEAAGDLAEHDLIAAARGATGWLFIGEGGALFEADEPLGPFKRVLSAPEPVARIEASPAGLLAVTQRGALLRSSDGGVTFQRAPLDVPFVGDVQMVDGGHGLLLSFPERLHETHDGGLSWKPLEARPVGAARLLRLGDDSVLVHGATSLAWKSDGRLRPTQAKPEASVFKLPFLLGVSPDASSASAGGAFWRGDQWVEVRPPDRRGGLWSLNTSKPGGRLETAPLEGTDGCQRLAVDGNEQTTVVACSTMVRGSSLASVRLLRYGSSGHPDELADTLDGSLGEARVAVGRDGRVLAWGVCRAGSGRAACDGETALLMPQWPPGPVAAEAPTPWQTVAAAGQSGRPVAVRFGSGNQAYMVAQRGKTRDLGLFVSRDGGRTFEARDLGLAGALEEHERRILNSLRSASLSTHDEGIVTIAFEGQAGAVVAVSDEDGRVLSVTVPPVATAATRVGVAGRRLLAVDGARAFESLDGGVAWTPLGTVPALRCPERGTCDRRVSCGLAGCLVGDIASRVGWGGQGEAPRPPAEAQPIAALSRPPPPVVCRLGKEKWAALPKNAELPGIHRADRGKTAWASTAYTPLNGQLLSVHAATATGKVDETTVFAATRDVQRTAMAISQDQVEGVAAVRLELNSRTPEGQGLAIAKAEVAWHNFFEGKLSRVSLPAPGASHRTGLDLAIGQVSNAALPLISISNGGVFVRLGADLLFAAHGGKVERSAAPRDVPIEVDGSDLSMRSEAVRVDNRTVPIGYRDGLVARTDATPEFTSLFPLQTSPFHAANQQTFSYLNGAPFLVHIGVVPRTGASQVSLFPFQATGHLLGPRQAGPSQRALVDRFRACAPADRARTPRVIAPSEPGTRRGVLIEGPDGSAFAGMISEGMVLYGNAEAPCGSVIEGVPVARPQTAGQFFVEAEGRERALVFLNEQEKSWFFRLGVNDAVEYRAMSCKVSPNAALPPEVQTALDTTPSGAAARITRTRVKPKR